VDLEGANVEDLLEHLVAKYPKLRGELYEDDGALTDYFILFVNDRPINALDGVKTPLNDGDEVLFFIPISGG
jgi:MoaD family protein